MLVVGGLVALCSKSILDWLYLVYAHLCCVWNSLRAGARQPAAAASLEFGATMPGGKRCRGDEKTRFQKGHPGPRSKVSRARHAGTFEMGHSKNGKSKESTTARVRGLAPSASATAVTARAVRRAQGLATLPSCHVCYTKWFPTLPALDLAQPRALRRCRDKLTSAKRPSS